MSGAREREQTKKRREKPCIHHPPPSRLSLERGGVGALEGDAGVVDEDVAPAVLLLYLRGEPLASAASPGKTDTKHTKKKKKRSAGSTVQDRPFNKNKKQGYRVRPDFLVIV